MIPATVQIVARLRPTDTPAAWLQMSTATIYAHSYATANNDVSGVIGGYEEGVPGYWAFSVDIAQAWGLVYTELETVTSLATAVRYAAWGVAVRDSADRDGMTLTFTAEAWQAFVRTLR